ncbi:PLP-dependent aspartate aminotransferase family protein [Neorhizobium sp. NCHU2750]|uniref:trans-sulfuration enzyme family protein n=1 Tax=Neorhizobium sp. NCHU2750 TaxID=1825976 RepID=UPI000E758B83|nr:cystathionine gamma-synthase [Neorhizobium sp. NCHU2750]
MTNQNHQQSDTLITQALGWVDEASDALTPSIHPGTCFLRDPRDLHRAGRSFQRDDNPTFARAEATIAAIEGGDDCFLFASGMAAATAVMHMLEPGSNVVVPSHFYSGLRTWLVTHGARWNIILHEVDYSDFSALEAKVEECRPKLVWVESPANPTWRVTDLRAVADISHKYGALVVADNTVATPVITRPLELGVDIVLHSGSKYLNGHADVVAGALVIGRDQSELCTRIAKIRNDYGAVLGPFEAWLLLRGMRTLHLRMRAICDNAMQIASFLEGHLQVAEVIYPGLASHPQHVLATKQMHDGFGGMISFRVDGGEEAAHRLAQSTKIIRQAISFGGLESVIEIRRGMEGPDSKTPPDLLRLSVGVEAASDLINDLAAALSR